MRALLAITKALSDQNRIRILHALSDRGELCVCQIHEILGLAASTTSKHLSILAAAALVGVRRDGRWSYYRLSEDDALEGTRKVLSWICQHAGAFKLIIEDRKKLDEILTISPEELCRRQALGEACCGAEEVPLRTKKKKRRND